MQTLSPRDLRNLKALVCSVPSVVRVLPTAKEFLNQVHVDTIGCLFKSIVNVTMAAQKRSTEVTNN